jgi:ketosteroid isomerase-like protein
MAQHPSEKLLAELYDKFSKGDMPGVLGMCAPDMKWTVPGAAPFSGTYTNETFPGMVGEVMRISQGSFREEAVLFIASDDHGVAILDHFIVRDGKQLHYRTDHIWGIKDGKFTSWEERPGNVDEFNSIWAE